MFNPALTTQDVMNAGCYFVPFIVVPKPVNTKEIFHSLTFNLTQMAKVLQLNIHMQVQHITYTVSTYAGKVTWVVPIGTISMDFPQNLFFQRTS